MPSAMILAIFAASVLGSLHCAGMCGAFLAVAMQDCGNWRRHWVLQSAYHLGRLASYMILGTAAGAVGHLVNLGAALGGIRSAAAVLAGTTVVLFAVVNMLRMSGFAAGITDTPEWLGRISQQAYRRAMAHPPTIHASLIGLCTG